MKCIFFSDLHIKAPEDIASKLFFKLSEQIRLNEVTHIFFLGDIFDLMIGEHKEYFLKYQSFFNEIIKLLEEGKKIVFLEGNHDFHFHKSLEKFLKESTSNYQNFEYRKNGQIYNFGEKKYYVCHGDEVDDTNESFKKWKSIYTSKKFAFFVNKILNFKLIDYIGAKVSQNSKNRGRKSFDFENLQKRYREGAQRLADIKSVDGIICGHTHIQEAYQLSTGQIYYNCGHPISDKNYLLFDGKDFRFISLVDS